MTLRKNLLATAAAGALIAGLASTASAYEIAFNPSGTTPSVLSQGPFSSSGGVAYLSALLDITGCRNRAGTLRSRRPERPHQHVQLQ